MAIELWHFRSDVGQERADLRGMSVEALDGRVGKVEEVVQKPSASFLVVDTGPSAVERTQIADG
jgi:ribosomal 30S subunit maturation factor RimM